MRIRNAFFVFSLCVAVPLTFAFAQDSVSAVPGNVQSPQAAVQAEPKSLSASQSSQLTEFAEKPPSFSSEDYPSLLFTYWEHVAISDARHRRGNVRAPTEAELERDLNTMQKEKVKPPPEERDISLGGIVYHSRKDWTIWLNGKRVTPDALPTEVIDLRVHGEFIEIKWFDEYSNQIFPIRLRPHQRFNIDTRIFLPG